MQPCWVTSSVWSTGPACRVGGAKREDTEVWEEVMLGVMEVVVPPSGTGVPSLAVGTKDSDLAVLEDVLAASVWRGGRNANHNLTRKQQTACRRLVLFLVPALTAVDSQGVMKSASSGV